MKKTVRKGKKSKPLKQRAATRGKFHDAFGLWSNRKIDGLEYQRKLRAEWERDGK